MVITKPIGILFENGQKLDEGDLEKKNFYKTSIVRSSRKSAPLKWLKNRFLIVLCFTVAKSM